MVVFDTGEGSLWENLVALQSLFLSRCGDNAEIGGTKNVVLEDGYGQFRWICL